MPPSRQALPLAAAAAPSAVGGTAVLPCLAGRWVAFRRCILSAVKVGTCEEMSQWIIFFNPRTAGGLSHLRTAGGGGGRMTAPPPENSKTKKDSDKR